MTSKLSLRLSQLFESSPVRQLRSTLDKRVSGKVLLKRRAVLSLAPRGQVMVLNGSLTIGKKWVAQDPFPTFVSVGEQGKLEVRGNFAIGTGSRIHVMDGATLSFGGGYANHELKVDCFDRITIGTGVAIASNVTLRDSDNKARTKGSHAQAGAITIGDNVWIGMNVTILKGVTIGDGAIIAAGALVNRDVPARTLVAGVPATVAKSDIQWFD